MSADENISRTLVKIIASWRLCEISSMSWCCRVFGKGQGNPCARTVHVEFAERLAEEHLKIMEGL